MSYVGHSLLQKQKRTGSTLFPGEKFVLLPPPVDQRSWAGWPAPVAGPVNSLYHPKAEIFLCGKKRGMALRKGHVMDGRAAPKVPDSRIPFQVHHRLSGELLKICVFVLEILH